MWVWNIIVAWESRAMEESFEFGIEMAKGEGEGHMG